MFLLWATRTCVVSRIAAESINRDLIASSGWIPWRGDALDDTMPIIDVVRVSVKLACVSKRGGRAEPSPWPAGHPRGSIVLHRVDWPCGQRALLGGT
jgi:hypothetical protein